MTGKVGNWIVSIQNYTVCVNVHPGLQDGLGGFLETIANGIEVLRKLMIQVTQPKNQNFRSGPKELGETWPSRKRLELVGAMAFRSFGIPSYRFSLLMSPV